MFLIVGAAARAFKHAHRQAVDQAPRRLRVPQFSALPEPGEDQASRLAKARRNLDEIRPGLGGKPDLIRKWLETARTQPVVRRPPEELRIAHVHVEAARLQSPTRSL